MEKTTISITQNTYIILGSIYSSCKRIIMCNNYSCKRYYTVLSVVTSVIARCDDVVVVMFCIEFFTTRKVII